MDILQGRVVERLLGEDVLLGDAYCGGGGGSEESTVLTLIPAEKGSDKVERYSDRLPAEVGLEILDYLTTKEELSPDDAVAALENSLMMLDALGKNPGLSLAPSPTVDLAWHRLILHTETYAEYCDEYANRFIHHRPELGSRPVSVTSTQSFELLRDLGYDVEPSIWNSSKTDCSGCSGCDGGGGGGDRCDSGCDGV